MGYIEYEIEFRSFMEHYGPENDRSKSNYISWLNFLSDFGVSINSNLKSNESIIKLLKEKESERDRYKSEEAYSDFGAALNKYRSFINENDSSAADDVNEINNSDLSKTEKGRLVNARLGQGKYRKDLIELWGKCSVTGLDKVEFLTASHILPWRSADNSQRLNKYNGLLLTPNYDKLFDKGYISFENDGGIILSKKLSQEVFDQFGISKSDKLQVLFNENIPYLTMHREIFKSILYED